MARESKTKADRPTSSPMVDDVICVIEFPENTSAELLNFIEQCIQLPKVTQLSKENASKERGDRERSTPDYGTGLQCSRSDQHNQVRIFMASYRLKLFYEKNMCSAGSKKREYLWLIISF